MLRPSQAQSWAGGCESKVMGLWVRGYGFMVLWVYGFSGFLGLWVVGCPRMSQVSREFNELRQKGRGNGWQGWVE